MERTEQLRSLVEKLFEKHGVDTDEGRALECQVAFTDGSAARGVLAHGPSEGSWHLLTPILDQRTKQPVGAIDLFFLLDVVRYFGLPRDAEKQNIVAPPGATGGNLILP